jgi:RimJ/RimL family protein N-acetyltransferase
VKWFNDPEITQFLLMYPPMTLEAEENWFQNSLHETNEKYFCIHDITREDQLLIGNCGVRIDWKNRVGNVGIVIGKKEYWGKGFGTEAMQLLVNYAFNTLNLHRVELDTYSHNIRAQKSYTKIGFKIEGTKRDAVYIDGKYRDVVVMSILKEEFRQLHPAS